LTTYKFVDIISPLIASIENVASSGKVNSKPVDKWTAPLTMKMISIVGTSPMVVEGASGMGGSGNYAVSSWWGKNSEKCSLLTVPPRGVGGRGMEISYVPEPVKAISKSKWPEKFFRAKSIWTLKASLITSSGSFPSSSMNLIISWNTESSVLIPGVVATPVPVV
jgi:hypothetical protein